MVMIQSLYIRLHKIILHLLYQLIVIEMIIQNQTMVGMITHKVLVKLGNMNGQLNVLNQLLKQVLVIGVTGKVLLYGQNGVKKVWMAMVMNISTIVHKLKTLHLILLQLLIIQMMKRVLRHLLMVQHKLLLLLEECIGLMIPKELEKT